MTVGYLVYEIATGDVRWGAQCELTMFPPPLEDGLAAVRWPDWQHEELYFVEDGEVRKRTENPARVERDTVAAFGDVEIADIPKGCQVIWDALHTVDDGTFTFRAFKGMNRISLRHPCYLDRDIEVRGI